MKRFYWALVTLGLLLTLGLTTKHLVLQRLEPVQQELVLSLEALGQQQWDQAQLRLERSAAAWQDSWHLMGMLLPHDPLEEGDELLDQARLYLENREQLPLSSVLTQLQTLLEALIDAQKPTFWNLF